MKLAALLLVLAAAACGGSADAGDVDQHCPAGSVVIGVENLGDAGTRYKCTLDGDAGDGAE